MILKLMMRSMGSVMSWSCFQGLRGETTRARRRWFLQASLLMLTGFALLFYGLKQPEYDHRVHLVVAVLYMLIFLALYVGASFKWSAHLAFLVSMGHVLGLSMGTGGINSTVMAWMTPLVLPIIMLLGKRAALWWAGLAVIVHFLMLYGTQNGTFDSLKRMDNDVVAWTLVNKVIVVCLTLAAVYMADYMHRLQVLALDGSNQELEKTQEALRQAQAHKEEFIASVGHELRTPMNAILGLNGILRTELVQRKEDVVVVDHIRQSTEQLLQVVNDILDFSQLQAGQLSLQIQTFNLVETVQETLDLYQDKAGAKGLALGLNAKDVKDIWVVGDRYRLVQVLRNLLDNAFKFTHQGHIDVRIRPHGMGFMFEVEDTGIGIPVDRQQQVFDRFEFADLHTNRQYGGTGLGLSICERLVSLQGGHIGVRSMQGQGTLFWFELPLARTTAPQHNTGLESMTDMLEQPWKILLVDDNSVNLMVARLMLKKHFKQAEISEAEGGQEALDLLKTSAFDLVLMDMVMPGVDGLQATQSLRHEFAKPICDMPVLGLTASTHPMDREKCLAAGMNDVLSKPLDEKQMLALITKALNKTGTSA